MAAARRKGLISMTGYGTATVPIAGGRLTVEVRAVNQRFIDVRVTAPREYAAWEATCRDAVRKRVARGRVEVTVTRSAPATTRTHVVVDLAAVREHAAAWRKVQAVLGLKGPLDLSLLRPGDVFQTVDVPGEVTAEFPAANRALAMALERFERERRREGANLQKDMRARIDRIAAIAVRIRRYAASAVRDFQTRLTERMTALLQGQAVDPARILQEAAYLAEKSDVTEELVRLASHLDALRKSLVTSEPAGKQIEFLLQELGREINTIGSKVGKLEVTNLVVEAKGEAERLREQVQNVE